MESTCSGLTSVMNVHKMIGVVFILVYPVLFLGANGQDLTCSTSYGSSCESVTPLIGPPCPTGFDYVDSYCIKIINELAYWDESRLRCEEINATLAEPKGDLTNWVLTKYLLQQIELLGQIDENKRPPPDQQKDLQFQRDEDHRFHDGIYNIGGHFINDSWQWFTGGDMDLTLYGSDTYGCLAMYVFSDPRKPQPRYPGNHKTLIGYSMHNVPCNKDAMQWARKLNYLCEAPLSNDSYKTCEQDGKTYLSGKRVSMDAQRCQQQWCQDGTIQSYTCGDIKTGCCEYKDVLYGNGEFIGPEVPTADCNSCHQRICQDGVIQWLNCTNCTVQCCHFNDVPYQPGSYIEGACARLECVGTTGQFRFEGTDPKCEKCQAYLDPHIVAYGLKYSYSYQGCGNYSFSQNGNSYDPTLALYATFEPCGGRSGVSCVDSITFKNDEHTVISITVEFNSGEIQVHVNGNYYNVTSYTPRVIRIMNITYPVLAWNYWNCVNLQGSEGFLVRFCGSNVANQVYVWAHSDITGDLLGLCGNVNESVNDLFACRNWKSYPWPNSTSSSPDPPPCIKSWLTSNTSTGDCGDANVGVKRQTQNNCYNNARLEVFRKQCNLTVSQEYSDAEPEEAQTITDDCVFDLCHVSDPDTWIKGVRNTAQVQADIQKNTLNSTTATTATTSAPTTVEAYIPPNITTDGCHCSRKCWRNSGYCTKDPDSCDGRKIEGGCDGPGCDCCVPKGCQPKGRCRRRGGVCTSSAECKEDYGIPTPDCHGGTDCVCCLKPDRCKPKRNCWIEGGFCVTSPIHCNGTIINIECKLKVSHRHIPEGPCYCCVNYPHC